MNRREFFIQTGKILAGGTLLWLVGFKPNLMDSTGSPTNAAENVPAYDWEKYLYAFVVDTTKCIGCGKCVAACKSENNVPNGQYRTWVERYIITNEHKVLVDSPEGGINSFKNNSPSLSKGEGFSEEIVKAFFVPKLCNHCSKPVCVQVCPVGATYRTKDGVVLIDAKHCVGCGYCVQSCPYGARYINIRTHTADKCSWCYHRITKGLLPACVQACPRGARLFGNLKDPESEIKQIIDKERVGVLKQAEGTEPNVYYLGFDKEII